MAVLIAGPVLRLVLDVRLAAYGASEAHQVVPRLMPCQLVPRKALIDQNTSVLIWRITVIVM